jgi:hypothetical protein
VQVPSAAAEGDDPDDVCVFWSDEGVVLPPPLLVQADKAVPAATTALTTPSHLRIRASSPGP